MLSNRYYGYGSDAPVSERRQSLPITTLPESIIRLLDGNRPGTLLATIGKEQISKSWMMEDTRRNSISILLGIINQGPSNKHSRYRMPAGNPVR